jgi:hypothetical protein
MKKIYLGVFTLCMAVSGTAQHNLTLNNVNKESHLTKEVTNESKAIKMNNNYSKAALLWSDDCSNAGNWVITNTGTHTVGWGISTNPAVIPVSVLAPMASATASNGFMFINSDGNNTADSDGTRMVSQFTNATAIDLTGYPNVSLEFSHNYRWWQEDRGVRISGDNGSTWQDFLLTSNAGSPASQNSGNPEITRIDISSVAGNSSQVLVQFFYDDYDFWGWYWAVDDIKIVENDANDVKVDEYFRTDINADFEYSQIPLEQVRPISFGIVANNIGINSQSVVMDFDVMMGGSSVESGSSAATTITSNIIDTIFHTTGFTPSSLGMVTVNLSAAIAVDDVPSNNSFPTIDLVEVTNYVWAKDDNLFSSSLSNVTSQPGQSLEIGNRFLANAASTVSHIHVGIANVSSNTGQLVYAKIYVYDAGTAAYVFAEVTDDHAIVAGDLGQVVSLELNNNYDLVAGGDYLVVAGHYGGTTEVEIGMSGHAIEGDVLGFTADGSAFNLSGPEAIMVRMGLLDPSASVEEIVEGNLTVSQNFPNPFSGNTTVNYTLASNDEVMVEITDVTGKVIEVMNEGVRTAGSHVLTINSNKLSAGTYYYTLSTSNGKVTKSMNVTK